MTIDKNKTINIPIWLVSILLPLLVTIVTSLGILASTKATLELKASRNSQDIETLRKEKVSRDEFNLIIDKLNTIDKKFDIHTQR